MDAFNAHIPENVSLFGKPEIDLFASRLNVQVDSYVSWRQQPMATFLDAFCI